jgi:hypothetical protein
MKHGNYLFKFICCLYSINIYIFFLLSLDEKIFVQREKKKEKISFKIEDWEISLTLFVCV